MQQPVHALAVQLAGTRRRGVVEALEQDTRLRLVAASAQSVGVARRADLAQACQLAVADALSGRDRRRLRPDARPHRSRRDDHWSSRVDLLDLLPDERPDEDAGVGTLQVAEVRRCGNGIGLDEVPRARGLIRSTPCSATRRPSAYGRKRTGSRRRRQHRGGGGRRQVQLSPSRGSLNVPSVEQRVAGSMGAGCR